jgi:hypothetical protein
MLFNINDDVEVQLTGTGRRILGTHLVAINPTTLDGWTKFQMWDLMARFGPYLKQGFQELRFATNIRISEK